MGINPVIPIIILILMIPLYFISKALMNRFKIGRESNRKYLAIIPSAILSPIIYLCAVMIMLFFVSYYPKVDFDKSEWKNNSETRYTMGRDIIKSRILLGLSRDQIADLLGSDFNEYDQNYITYYIGYVPGIMSLDPGKLHIYFENDLVTDVKMTE